MLTKQNVSVDVDSITLSAAVLTRDGFEVGLWLLPLNAVGKQCPDAPVSRIAGIICFTVDGCVVLHEGVVILYDTKDGFITFIRKLHT